MRKTFFSILAVLCLSFAAGPVAAGDIWTNDINAALEEARDTGKDILLFGTTTWCGPCKKLKADVLTNPEFKAFVAKHFVPVWVDVDNDDLSAFKSFEWSHRPRYVPFMARVRLRENAKPFAWQHPGYLGDHEFYIKYIQMNFFKK